MKKKKTKHTFLFHPNNPDKSFDVYIDKDPTDTIPIFYTTLKDVKDTIKKLEKLFRQKKYSHKRIWQVGMILFVRLRVLKDKKPHHFKLSQKYFKFLGERTKIKDHDSRKKLRFKFNINKKSKKKYKKLNMNNIPFSQFKSKREYLLNKCGLPDIPETSHCFNDATHHTCCELSEEARSYADKSGNPIGKLAEDVFKQLPKNHPKKNIIYRIKDVHGALVLVLKCVDIMPINLNKALKLNFLEILMRKNMPKIYMVRKDVRSMCEISLMYIHMGHQV